MSLDELPRRIREMGELAIKCKTITGRATHLQRFLYALLSEKRYGYAIFHAYKKLLKQREEEIGLKKDGYHWMQNEVERLSKSRAAGIPFVAATIRHFRQLLAGKRPLISNSFFGIALEAYKQVAFAIQPFGEMELLEGTGEFVQIKESYVFEVDEFPINVNKAAEVFPLSDEGRVLVKKLGQGFQSAVLRRVKLVGEEKEVIYCDIQFLGSLTFNWPNSIGMVLERENSNNYQETLEINVGIALGHINFVTQICNRKLLEGRKRWRWPKVADPIALDRAVEEWHTIRYCLSLVNNSDPVDILSQEAVKEIVELFSSLVSSVTYHKDEIEYAQWKSWLSNEAANYAEKILVAWLTQMEPEKRRLIRKDDAYIWLVRWMKEQELPAEFIALTTETLIKETVAPNVKKCIEWNPMRDGPKRQEELKKHGSIHRSDVFSLSYSLQN